MRLLRCLVVLGCISSFAAIGFGQNTNSGDIRGTVVDASGAVLPGANVTVTNTDTGVVTKYVSNADGLYDTNSILPGNYSIEVSKEGFATFKRTQIVLEVGTITVDATLKVGSSNQVVEVSSAEPLLKTEDAAINTTLSTQQLTDLPNVDPTNGWTYLLKLLPGATSTPGGTNGGGSGDQNPGVDQAIAGTMPYFSSYLVDGGSIWLPHSANIDQGQSETVAEVNVITTTAPAQYGGGGNVFNVISKSGTNNLHGAAYEYFQNDALNARDYFNTTGAKAKQRFNYFGLALGGPVIKNKLFFYYNYQQLENPSNSIATFSVPTADMKAGCFDPTLFGTNLTLDPAHGGTPLTTNPAQCGAFNPADLALPTADFDPVAAKIQAFYPAPNLPGLSSNYSYLKAANGNSKKHFGRLDYNISNRNRINLSVTMHDNPHKTNWDPGPVCPINCENNSGEGYQAQISDVFTFGTNMVNEFRYSFVRQGNWFVPQTLDKGFPAQLGLLFSTADVFPTVAINGTGGPNNLAPGTNAVFIENTFIPSDVLTMIRGKHILHFGGEVMFEQDNSTPWGSINGANFTFTGQYTTNNPTVNVGYADFLLGDVQQWSTSTQPEHGMRARNPSFFVQDDIKLRPNLTVNLGVRAEIHGGMTEVQNHMGGFDPTITNPVTNTLGSIWFAGLNGARNQNFETKAEVMPRLGFAWQLTDKWVVRGGVGQYAALWSVDTVGGPLGFGTGVTGTASANPGQAPVVQLSGTGAGLPTISGRNPASYITPATPQGNGFIPYTPYDLPIMNGWQWTGSVQRRLPANMVMEAQYVGNHWVNQEYLADINQVPANLLGGGQAARPFPQFSGIGIGSGGSRTGLYNGVSNYEAASVLLKKPMGYGLSADLAYTWSRLKDDMDSSGWGEQFGAVYYQDAYNPSSNYALSNFDRPNSFKGEVVYALPLGRGRRYLSSPLADAALGGWQASTSFVAESGAPFTLIMNSATPDGALDGNLYPNLVGNPHVSNPSLSQWYNQLAYAAPPANSFGDNPRNSLRGPRLTDFDFSLAKSWGMPRWEQARLQLRLDATNIFNHPSFQNPSNSLNPSALSSGVPDPSVGRISATTITGRSAQVSARFSF
jgi:Carboxypeptidase regulatory-like domain